MWKGSNIEKYPTKLKKLTANDGRATTTAVNSGNLMEDGAITLAQNTFYNDATKTWNLAPLAVKTCKTIWSAKKEIKKFMKTLPV